MPLLRDLSELFLGKKTTQALSAYMPQATQQQRSYQHEKEYIAREAAVGARILGPIPSGHEREFFCLDRNTWIWHESWKDESSKYQEFTVNYEVDPTGILKRVNGGSYTKLQGEELARFDRAIRTYYVEVARQVYGKQVPALA
jgi:hypothetical protein